MNTPKLHTRGTASLKGTVFGGSDTLGAMNCAHRYDNGYNKYDDQCDDAWCRGAINRVLVALSATELRGDGGMICGTDANSRFAPNLEML